MPVGRKPGVRARDPIAFLCAVSLPLPWIFAHVAGWRLGAVMVASLAGLAIVGAAATISWGAELAERDIPQALAILFLALVSVLPEYAVDLHFAWRAGGDPSYAPYAVANMTGANRLLIGLGWTSVVLIGCLRTRRREILIHPKQRLEVRFLVWATLYSFLIPLSGTINLFDALVLFAIFGAYAVAAMRSGGQEVELVGPAAMIDRGLGDAGRRLVVIAIFAFCSYAIFVAAEPFAESLVTIGRHRDVDEFLLVQWVAPLASESPEFAIAILFAVRMRASLGIGALVSSKVNQWTLLVGAIPIAFAISSGGTGGLPLDARQTEELVLTSAQSLLGAVVIADFRFSRREALALAALFLLQFAFPGTQVRWAFTGLYLAITLGLLLAGGAERRVQFFRLVLPSGRGGVA